MNKFLVLTSITNGKDKLLDPPIKFDNCDYIAFVDKKYDDVKVWEQRDVFNFSFIDKYRNRRNAKLYKILSTLMFPQYEYIIWEDGNHQLKIDPQLIIDEYGADADLLLFKHPDRTCAYQEMGAVAEWRLDEVVNLQNQYNFYKSMGMPENWGLFELSTFIKKVNPITTRMDLMWWENICKFSSRDQLSLPYVLWALDKKIVYKFMKGYANLINLANKNNPIKLGNEYFNDQGRHLKNN